MTNNEIIIVLEGIPIEIVKQDLAINKAII